MKGTTDSTAAPTRRSARLEALLSGKPEQGGIALTTLQACARSYIAECGYRMLSPRTREMRESITSKFVWYCVQFGHASVNRSTVEAFLLYLPDGHKNEGGRWGTGTVGESRPLTDRTIGNYFRWLRGFFLWCVAQEYIEGIDNPMRAMKPPQSAKKKLPPVTTDQIRALLIAARGSQNPARDEAVLLLMYDAGLRVAELCALRRSDLDLRTGRVHIRSGKGKKDRFALVADTAKAALKKYVRQAEKLDVRNAEHLPLFLAERGPGVADHRGLTPEGIRLLLRRLKQRAKLPTDAPIHPHAFRRAFATTALENGADTLLVQTLLGHSTPTMTLHYASYGDETTQRKHRAISPVESLKGGHG